MAWIRLYLNVRFIKHICSQTQLLCFVQLNIVFKIAENGDHSVSQKVKKKPRIDFKSTRLFCIYQFLKYNQLDAPKNVHCCLFTHQVWPSDAYVSCLSLLWLYSKTKTKIPQRSVKKIVIPWSFSVFGELHIPYLLGWPRTSRMCVELPHCQAENRAP